MSCWKDKKKRAKVRKKFKKTLRWFDYLFPQPITVNYSGEDSFRTVYGGICTILVCIVMLFWII